MDEPICGVRGEMAKSGCSHDASESPSVCSSGTKCVVAICHGRESRKASESGAETAAASWYPGAGRRQFPRCDNDAAMTREFKNLVVTLQWMRSTPEE